VSTALGTPGVYQGRGMRLVGVREGPNIGRAMPAGAAVTQPQCPQGAFPGCYSHLVGTITRCAGEDRTCPSGTLPGVPGVQ